MAKLTLNQLLAENLANLMRIKGISANALGASAGLSPRTLANYLKTDHNPTAKGKERSAKLTEVEKLASALGVSPVELFAAVPESALPHQRQAVEKIAKKVDQPFFHATGSGKNSTAIAAIQAHLAGRTILTLSDHIRPHSNTRREIIGNLLLRLANDPDNAEVAEELSVLIDPPDKQSVAA